MKKIIEHINEYGGLTSIDEVYIYEVDNSSDVLYSKNVFKLFDTFKGSDPVGLVCYQLNLKAKLVRVINMDDNGNVIEGGSEIMKKKFYFLLEKED